MEKNERRFRHTSTGIIVTNCYQREGVRTHSVTAYYYVGKVGQWIDATIVESTGLDWIELTPVAWKQSNGSYTHIAPAPIFSEDEYMPIWTVDELIQEMNADHKTERKNNKVPSLS